MTRYTSSGTGPSNSGTEARRRAVIGKPVPWRSLFQRKSSHAYSSCWADWPRTPIPALPVAWDRVSTLPAPSLAECWLDGGAVRIWPIMAQRYLYGQDGTAIGYMDSRDKYLYSTAGAAIAYWDSRHKYMYTPTGETFGYIDSRGRYLYAQSGETVGYFHPPYDE